MTPTTDLLTIAPQGTTQAIMNVVAMVGTHLDGGFLESQYFFA